MKTFAIILAVVTLVVCAGCVRTHVYEPPPDIPIPPMFTVSCYTPRKTNALYVVQAGDNLRLVAMMWAVPIELIRQENSVTETSLTVGQELVIPPAPPRSTNIYTIPDDFILCIEE